MNASQSPGRNRRVVLGAAAAGTLLAAVLFFAWPRTDAPPSITTVLGRDLPASAVLVRTHAVQNPLTSQDVQYRAIVRIDDDTFQELSRALKLEPHVGNKPHVFDRAGLEWWDLANLPDSPVLVRSMKEPDGGESTLFVKYERGRMYIVRNYFAPR
ncbi:MAG: hypothetical protein U0935_25225 [Pirellulales bacterium]